MGATLAWKGAVLLYYGCASVRDLLRLLGLAMETEAAERALLAAVDREGSVGSEALAATLGWDHLRLVGTIKSLESFELIAAQARRRRHPLCLLWLTAP